MNFKAIINSLFAYTPQNEYEFDIPENITKSVNDSNSETSKQQKIFSNLNKNLDYVKTSYNTLINSDIVVREFILNARNKQYNAFLLYIDGMIDSNIMNDFILKPLMLKNQSNMYDKSHNTVVSELINNNVTIRKIKNSIFLIIYLIV